jgi:hypothetical protein
MQGDEYALVPSRRGLTRDKGSMAVESDPVGSLGPGRPSAKADLSPPFGLRGSLL